MIRVLLYFIVVAVIGYGFAWLANHSGDMVMTISNQRIALPLYLALGLALFVLAATLCIIWFLRAIFTAPKNIAQHFETQNKKRGYAALSKGMLAALSGDVTTAIEYKKRAVKLLGTKQEPLVKMLEAHTYLLDNDTANAIMVFEDMSKDPKTRLAGLHGLYREAIKSGAYEAANQYAEQASQVSNSVQWANQAMLDHFSAEGEWEKALSLFKQEDKALPRAERNSKKRNHQRAVLWTGKAIDLFETQPEEARKTALKAQKFDTEFVPSTVAAADILYQLHETRKADKMVEALWRKTPHPDLADIYIKAEQPAHERLKRAQNLAAQNPEQFESCIIIARAALDAGELPLARTQVEKAIHLSARESAYLLLADIEEAMSGDQGLVRQWLSLALRAKQDPVWIADGMSFAKWSAVSPLSGKLDAFEWKLPSRQLGLALEEDEILPKIIKLVEESPIIESATSNEIVPKKAPEEALNIDEIVTPAQKPNKKYNVANDDKNAEELANQAVPTRINVDDPGVSKKE